VFRYPYGCVEQQVSALTPLVYFGDYINVFGLDSEVNNPRRLVASRLKELGRLQKADGGFPYWPTGNASHVFPSLKMGELLAAARERGVSAPDNIDIKRLTSYLESFREGRAGAGAYQKAYTEWVIARLGGSVSRPVCDEALASKDAGLAETAYIALAYLASGDSKTAADIQGRLRRFVSQSARSVDLTESAEYRRDWDLAASKSGDLALLLTLYAKTAPDDALCAKLLDTLLQELRAGNGYWQNTAVTARALAAVAEWIRARDLMNTDFEAAASIGDFKALSARFRAEKGVFGSPKTLPAPAEKTFSLDELARAGVRRGEETEVAFTREGEGSLFYTLSMKYELSAAAQEPRDQGISVFMEMRDAVTGKAVPGAALESGRIYQARLTLSSTRDRSFVALRAPIPAGAEVLNAAFATTSRLFTAAEKEDAPVWRLSSQRIYNNEVQYFWDSFPKGRQQVDFLFRAVRKGEYRTPAAQAECMYEPEVFGRWKGAVWTIQ
jgi:uncharacterized protein YfaS (alpha-2-macroglobulin family)